MAKHGGIYLYSLEAKAEGLFSQVNTAYIRRYSKKTKKQNKTKKNLAMSQAVVAHTFNPSKGR